MPAAVAAPYEHGAQRQVVSQREHDLGAISLARRKGMMLAQLDALAADDRLHPESVPVVEWLAGEVRAAGTSGRLDDLAALVADPAAGIRRRHFWQGQPPDALEGEIVEGEIVDDEDVPYFYDTAGQLAPGIWDGSAWVPAAPRLAIAASPAMPAPAPPGMTWADALAAGCWQLMPAPGGCQVAESGQPCAGRPGYRITGGWACSHHYQQLSLIISDARRPA